MNPEQMTESKTGIAVGHGVDVPTALKTLVDEIDKLVAGREWDMKHFTMYQEMKLVPLQQSAQILHYAIAVITFRSVGVQVIPAQQQ